MSDLRKANKELAEAVTGGFRRIEDSVVGGYRKIEDAFVGRFLTHEGETAEEARERLAQEQSARSTGKHEQEKN